MRIPKVFAAGGTRNGGKMMTGLTFTAHGERLRYLVLFQQP
jgi:hypothetical protein